MLRSFILVIVATFPIFAFSKTLDVTYNDHNDVVQIQTSEKANTNVVEFHDDTRLLGQYHNLIVDELAVTSTIVRQTGGGVAIVIDSNGSRNKYHVVVPILKDGQELFIDCIYKTSYDSVAEGRSVGSSCRKRSLAEFDIGSAISDAGMITYTGTLSWLGAVSKITCQNAVGFELAGYRVVRCSEIGLSDTRMQTIFTFDKNGNQIFSVSGYELIPSGNNFSLIADLQNATIVFSGIWRCYQYNSASEGIRSENARIADRFPIKFTMGSVNGCLIGHYSYIEKNGQITLKGSRQGRALHLLELDSRKESTGLFMLDGLASGVRGVWVAAPPKEVLTVDQIEAIRQTDALAWNGVIVRAIRKQ